MVAVLEDHLANADSGRAFIEVVLEGLAAEAVEPAPRGCLAMNSANELGAAVPTLSSEVSHCFASVTRVFHRAMILGQTDGSIGRARDADDLARYLVAHIGGVRNLIRGGAADPDQVRRLNVITLEALA